MNRRNRKIAALALVAGMLAGCGGLEAQIGSSDDRGGGGGGGGGGKVDVRAARTGLDQLDVKGRAPMTGYDRDRFGPAWADVDHNGCDTRNDILKRDLKNETFKKGTHDCIVLTGTLDDPYSGKKIEFERGTRTSMAVQIDHVVALGDAWQKGAAKWAEAKRKELANDPLNLMAVDGPLNGQKQASDAATWLPPRRAYRCDYVARQIDVKVKYDLWVTQAEKEAMRKILADC
ncbi:HNH endonuclease family protein [Spongiactinospora sp. TRM90649]|uniref:HNH endonuclease family protein n=1 Tax=Spongiactinospora sp. TRM90649 TaxID=3031114 RepID=UPI0023F9CD97|nr:HNH endonuclease family protein [Spongiactinospora sp. TRM90649]MDF5754077.1 HNH endonuclease family protein [Spongiactinospora sp. TRM90649]